MRHWPIAVAEDRRCTLISIPSYFSDSEAPGSHIALEQLAGDEWSQTLLSRLLPRGCAWAWWTRTRVFKQSGLPASRRAPKSIDAGSLTEVQARGFYWRGMTLAFIPAGQHQAQDKVLYWSGLDTEQVADQIWVAGSDTRWQPHLISSWCSDPSQWRRRQSVGSQPAEMILVMFDSSYYCACPLRNAVRILDATHKLAADWNLEVVSDAPERAWLTSRA